MSLHLWRSVRVNGCERVCVKLSVQFGAPCTAVVFLPSLEALAGVYAAWTYLWLKCHSTLCTLLPYISVILNQGSQCSIESALPGIYNGMRAQGCIGSGIGRASCPVYNRMHVEAPTGPEPDIMSRRHSLPGALAMTASIESHWIQGTNTCMTDRKCHCICIAQMPLPLTTHHITNLSISVSKLSVSLACLHVPACSNGPDLSHADCKILMNADTIIVEAHMLQLWA